MNQVQKILSKALAGPFTTKSLRDAVMAAHRARQAKASRKAKRLLLQYPQISLEAVRDSEGMGYWVNCSALDPDPLESHFATSWEEALDLVEFYVEALDRETEIKGTQRL